MHDGSVQWLGLENNLALTKHGQSGGIRSNVSDPVHGRRALKIGQALNAASQDIRKGGIKSFKNSSWNEGLWSSNCT